MDNKNIPAFPVDPGIAMADTDYIGLTKREYFAAMAMQGLLANTSSEVLQSELSIAEMAVTNADALLKQLEK